MNSKFTRITALLLCAVMVFYMTGCGEKESKRTEKQIPDGPEATLEEEAEETEEEKKTDEETEDEQGEDTAASSETGDKTGSSPSHSHSYKSKTVKATCASGGYILYTCSCGESYTSGQTGALGHSYGEWKVEKQATASSAGSRVRTCARCGHVQRESITAIVDTSSYASEVVSLVNSERAKAGLAPLKAVSSLNSYAYIRSQELRSVFNHVRPDGSNPLNYVIYDLGYMAAGENIAMSSGAADTPARVMNGWMNSSGHRANILSSDFSYIGVGCYHVGNEYYWTQIFAG